MQMMQEQNLLLATTTKATTATSIKESGSEREIS